MDNNENCRLYKVSWNLATHSGGASKVLDLTGFSIGVVEPAVDRTGRRLAVVASVGCDNNSGAADATGLMAWVPGGGAMLADFQRQGALRPTMPAWQGGGRLLWSRNAQGNKNEGWWGNLHRSEVGRRGYSDSVMLGGPDGSNEADGTAPCSIWPSADCVSWRDAAVFRDAPHHPGWWVTVFGRHGAPGAQSTESKPVVANLPDASTIEEFRLGRGRDAEQIESCHHPAWNVSGTEILCTRQHDADKASVPGLSVRGVYGYRWDGTRWASPREVVETTDLRKDFPVQFGAVVDSNVLTWKYAHWCRSDRYVVATVFAQIDDGDPVITSRVMLFDTATTPPGVWDLTDCVENLERASRGTYRAIYSACAGQG
jgi:hypothetical protein